MSETIEQRLSRIEKYLFSKNEETPEISFNHSASKIISVVSRATKLNESDIIGRSRKRQFVLARYVAINMISSLISPTMTMQEIGLFFGYRDHSTIVHAKNCHNDAYFTKDKEYIQVFEKCCELYYKELNHQSEPIINPS